MAREGVPGSRAHRPFRSHRRFKGRQCDGMTEWYRAALAARFCVQHFDRRKQSLQILLARQAVIAILDKGQHGGVTREVFDKKRRPLPGHIRVLHALQDVHRRMGADRPAEQQVISPSSISRRVIG